jgi:hypothetical protein
MPTYEDLQTLKRICVGEHRTAIQVFPPREKHIDIAGPKGTQVLHLEEGAVHARQRTTRHQSPRRQQRPATGCHER